MPSPKTSFPSRLAALLGFVVVSMTAGCGGGGGDGAPAPSPGTPFEGGQPVTASQFAGNYDVTYDGSGQGSCAVQILNDGSVTGQCVNETGQTEALSGSVSSPGAFFSTLGDVTDGAKFVGTLSGQSGSGSWSSTARSGTWALSAPAVVISALPDLTRPAPGSQAADGNGLEGVWRNGADEALIVSPTHLFLATAPASTADNVRGSYSASFSSTGGSFLLDADAIGFSATDAGPETGNASFTRRKTLGFTYRRASGTGPLGDYSATYDPLNALAVPFGDVQARWAGPGFSEFDILAGGALQGRTSGAALGDCQLSGSFTPAVVGTSRNLFDVSFIASGADCKLQVSSAYTGHAFLRVVDAGSAGRPFYRHSLQAVVAQGASGKPVALALTRR